MQPDPHHALIRFGLGRRAGEALPRDPVGWLHAQLERPDPARFANPPSTQNGLNTELRDQKTGRNDIQNDKSEVRALFRAEMDGLLDHALTTEAGFRERLVWFWANHFTVSRRRTLAIPVIGAFVQEAIRPHVTGYFVDMLLAVMRHPAMLFFLDNVQSVGPASPMAIAAAKDKAGTAPPRGLNENLARECLELHTISPAAGYTQADVTDFARVLTGWSIDLTTNPPGFRYRPYWHEPGTIRVLGREFPPGEEGGRAALMFLAEHPATYRHLAGKLARHFIADDPPPAAVETIAAALRASGGNLAAASRAVIGCPDAWKPLTKLRRPQDYVVAALRALDLPPDQQVNAQAVLTGLGQGMFNAPAPNGWPDLAEAWAAPEAMMRRIDWAFACARRAEATDPNTLAAATLGPLLSRETAGAMQNAGSRRDALALLLASPEFQRR